MAEDKTYNGWANYETWCVNLWLENDEGNYSTVLDKVDEITSNEENDDDAAYELSVWVRSFVEELAEATVPGLFDGGSFVLDLYQAAISEVNWGEITDAWLQTWKENQPSAV
jgi:hypothetical protein